jgi:hypothetical protein
VWFYGRYLNLNLETRTGVQKTFSRILEPSIATRWIVPTPTPISAAMRFQARPSATDCGSGMQMLFVR